MSECAGARNHTPSDAAFIRGRLQFSFASQWRGDNMRAATKRGAASIQKKPEQEQSGWGVGWGFGNVS